MHTYHKFLPHIETMYTTSSVKMKKESVLLNISNGEKGIHNSLHSNSVDRHFSSLSRAK